MYVQAHDYTDPALPLLRPEIRIGNQTWICANTFIGPDIEIGEGAVIGAGAVMVKNAEPWEFMQEIRLNI